MNFLFNINVCRVCMQNEQSLSLSSDCELKEMFTFTTRLTISDNDNLPKSICSKCMTRLKAAHKFIKKAHESEKNLKQFLAKISNEFKEVTQSSSCDENTDDDISNESEKGQDQNDMETNTSRGSTKPMAVNNAAKQSSNEMKRKSLSDEGTEQKKLKEENVTTKTNETEKTLEFEQETQDDVINVNSVYDLTEDIYLVHTDDQNEIELENKQNVHNDDIEQEEVDDDREVQEDEEEEFLLKEEEETIFKSPNYIIAEDANADLSNAPSGKVFSLNEEGSLTQMHELTQLNLEEHHLETLQENPEEMQVMVNSSQVGYLQEYETMLNNQVNVLNYNEDYNDDSSIEEIHLKDEVETFTEIVEPNDKSNPVPVAFSTSNVQKIDDNSKFKVRKEQATTATTQPRSRFYCEQCNCDFSTKTNLNRHMKQHEGSKPYACTECSKSFSQKSSLKLHIYTHTGEKPYVCEVCQRGFSQCKSLIFHMRRHTGEKPFQCEYCLIFFRQKDALRLHILKHHVITETLDNGTEIYSCIICKTKFKTKAEFKNHMKVHTASAEQIEFITDEPSGNGKIKESDLHTFKVVGSLENMDAAIINTSASSAAEPKRAKKYQCRKCFKCFVLKRSLVRHMRMHFSSTEVDILNAENISCDFQFESSEEYPDFLSKNHQVICSQCPDLIFKNMQDLKSHMLRHGIVQLDDE